MPLYQINRRGGISILLVKQDALLLGSKVLVMVEYMARYFLFITGGMAAFFFPFFAGAAGVVINEVMFDPAGDDSEKGTGKEWIELSNKGYAPIDLAGWQLYPDGIGYFSFPLGFTLAPKNFAVIHLRQSGVDTAHDLYFASPKKDNMGNISGSVALFSGEPRGKDTIQSFVQWGAVGKTWESDADRAGLWTKGSFIDLSDFIAGNSVALITDVIADAKEAAWHIAALPTKGGVNESSSISPPPSAGTSETTTGSFSLQSAAALSNSRQDTPKISAYAGEDFTAVAGNEANFIGSAFGTDQQPLAGAHYWWNFGDGETKEGRSVGHIFLIPGSYMVGLHISSGEYAASDYLRVEVVPNKVHIAGVLFGEEGYVRLANPSSLEIDMGGWIIEDGAGASFTIPGKTHIGARAEIGLANRVTGLFSATSSGAIVVRFANERTAFTYDPASLNSFLSVAEKKAADIKETASASFSIASLKPMIGNASRGAKELNNTPESMRGPSRQILTVTAATSQNVQDITSAFSGENMRVATATAAAAEAESRGMTGLGMFMAAAALSMSAAIGFFIIKTWIIRV